MLLGKKECNASGYRVIQLQVDMFLHLPNEGSIPEDAVIGSLAMDPPRRPLLTSEEAQIS